MTNILRSMMVLLAGMAGSRVLAHDTWIAPDRFHVAAPARVTLSLTSGMEFPKLDHAIQKDRIAIAKLRTSGGDDVDLEASAPGPNALELVSQLKTPGVTVLWIVLHPRPSELKPEQAREYVEHLGLADSESVIAAWERKPEPKSLRYRYTKYAKTFVRVAGREARDNWTTPVGMRLELVPEDDPTRRRAGDSIHFVLLDRGRPLAKYPVFLVREGKNDPVSYTTDHQGKLRASLPGAGRYMLRAATLEASSVPDTEWDVHFTTVTFEVRLDQKE